MLFEYGFKNFFSFREGVTISFRLDKNTPESVSRGREITPVLCVKGANAAGKTQALKGLSFLVLFCVHSFDSTPGAMISIESFYRSPDPTDFFVEFETAAARYRYECTLTEKKIVREALYRTKSKRVLILERIEDSVHYATKQLSAVRTIKLRSNASIISTIHQYELGLLEDVYNFFSNVLTNVGYSGLRDSHFYEIGRVAEILHSDRETLDFVIKFICECDTGVKDIKILEREGKNGENVYTPVFIHDRSDSNGIVTAGEESRGTKALFCALPFLKALLTTGGVLVMDEFDLHLHPHLLPKILDLFLDEEQNPNGAQILITSHDSAVIDYLGRYRTYLVSKRDNESFAYRLDSIPGDMLRNDRAISPIYNDGKIGGVPRV